MSGTGNYTVKSAADADAADAALHQQITDLTARVTALEGGTKPPIPPTNTVSPDGSKMPPAASLNSITSATDATLIVWTLVAGQLARGNPPVVDPLTSNVVSGEIVNHGQMRQTNTAGKQYDYTPNASYPWTAVAPPIPPQPPSGSVFTVAVGTGFKDPSGNPWTMKGLNMGVRDAAGLYGNVFRQFPGMSCIRLNTGAPDSDAAIDAVVKQYNSHNCVVMIEDHSGNRMDVNWYTRMATAYKANPLVFLEMPNEPPGPAATLAQQQITIINAIRAAGFGGPIGVTPAGGYDFSNCKQVLDTCGRTTLFLTPHIYYSGSDPNGAAQYVAADISQATNLGVFSSIDEFGCAMDGWHKDQFGAAVTTECIKANQAGKAGGVFWAANNGNHPDGADSAFLTTDGSQLTPVGTNPLKAWLS